MKTAHVQDQVEFACNRFKLGDILNVKLHLYLRLARSTPGDSDCSWYKVHAACLPAMSGKRDHVCPGATPQI